MAKPKNALFDKDVLEKAALAYGLPLGPEVGEYQLLEHRGEWTVARRNANGTWTEWNPLKSMGDALRLAVRRRFVVQVRDKVTFVCNRDGLQLDFRQHKDDEDFATRLAITRAAVVDYEKVG